MRHASQPHVRSCAVSREVEASRTGLSIERTLRYKTRGKATASAKVSVQPMAIYHDMHRCSWPSPSKFLGQTHQDVWDKPTLGTCLSAQAERTLRKKTGADAHSWWGTCHRENVNQVNATQQPTGDSGCKQCVQ